MITYAYRRDKIFPHKIMSADPALYPSFRGNSAQCFARSSTRPLYLAAIQITRHLPVTTVTAARRVIGSLIGTARLFPGIVSSDKPTPRHRIRMTMHV